MLLSYVNTKLRDEFSSLDEFCACMDISRDDIIKVLSAVGYDYSEKHNSFI